eukprot:Colp12_sorted_trinity150504_noHs@28995
MTGRHLILIALVACTAYALPTASPSLQHYVLVDVAPRGGVNAPEQVHIAHTGRNTEMMISYVTPKESRSMVEYGTSSGAYVYTAQNGDASRYNFLLYKSGYIHHVLLSGLQPATKYYYRVGDPTQQMSDEFTFTTAGPVGPEMPIVFGVAGDVGQTNFSAQTYAHMRADKTLETILHIGDLSYADGDQPRWDNWGRLVEPLAANVPYMTAAGNHEIESFTDKFLAFVPYQSRFRMPEVESPANQNVRNLYYSLDLANTHVIVLNSYSDFKEGSVQYEWLVNDLQKVDRSVTPWLIAMLHAPWYNSNKAHHDEAEEVGMRASMEGLLYQYKVDLVFAGHVHAYERTHRVYNGTLTPDAPYYIVIGDGGNREGLADTFYAQPEWSAIRNASYGHGRLETFNSTHACWHWYSDVHGEEIVGDQLWLIH